MEKVSMTVIRIGARDVGVAYNYRINEKFSSSGMRVYTEPEFLRKGKECSLAIQEFLKKEMSADIRIECIVYSCTKKSCLVKFGVIDEVYTMYGEQEIKNDRLFEILVQLYRDVRERLESELCCNIVQAQGVRKRAKKK